MAHHSFTAVVLAAGKATRFKSRYPKLLHRLAGLPLGEYAVRAALAAQPENTLVIVGFRAEEVRKAFDRPGLKFIEQKEQQGTGHAILTARQELEQSRSEHVLVLVGDAPLLRPETAIELVAAHAKARAAATILTTYRDDPHGYGRIVRGRGSQVRAIVEEKLCAPSQKKIREVNSGILCFTRAKLLERLGELSPDNAQGEYLLTDLAAIFNRHHEKVVAFAVNDAREVLGVNDRRELAQVERILRLRKADTLMREGVTIVHPETAYLDADVRVGPDTILEPGVSLLGRTVIGDSCTVRAYSTITDSSVGDRVTIRPYSMITDCEIASDVIIGPFAHLRDGSVVEQDARIGNFVEVKKTRVGRRTKAWHLTYLGDATLGSDVNVGAGTVTCNYDGKNKNPTLIEDGVFIGSGSMLVAPVKIGRGSYVAAGSAITENVPAQSLALGRAHQVNKEGWVRRRGGNRHPEEAGFSVAIRESGSVTIMDVQGHLTMGEPSDAFSQRIRIALGSGRRKVLVNLSRTLYIDSAGLGVLVGAMTAFRKARGDFKLACVSAKLQRIFETAKLRQAFEMFPDEATALKNFAGQLAF